ncbi:putative transcriptional regulator [Clostridium sp. ASBs410]|nr:putative transcriptional regulator [Clostridium sp. ASBs410]
MRLNIKDKLAEKKMTRYELAKRIGITYPTVTAIYNRDSTIIKLEILEALCKELECTPNDIIVSDDPTVSRLLLYVDKMQQDKEKDDRE